MRNKCVCIEDYFINNNVIFSIIYKKGEYYEYTDEKFVTRELPEGYNVMFSKGEYIFFRKYQDPLSGKGFGMFSTHFKTFNEIRKEKLKIIKELNGNNSQ